MNSEAGLDWFTHADSLWAVHKNLRVKYQEVAINMENILTGTNLTLDVVLWVNPIVYRGQILMVANSSAVV